MSQSSLIFLAVVAAASAACSSNDSAPAAPGAGGGAGSDASSTGGASIRHDSGTEAGDSGTFDTSGGPTDPIPTKPNEFVWVAFPDAKCRDGSSAGIYVSANPASDNLLIFLQGGGSCWNSHECAGNPANFTPSAGAITLLENVYGLFVRTRADNPVRDWNMVYVPYCTGDYHAGNNPGFDPGYGIGPQQYVGYTNLEKFFGRLVPTFPNVKKLLHSGYSAGGIGSVLTFELVAKHFPNADLMLLDDSGPPVPPTYRPDCIRERLRTTFGFDKTFLKDCGADCPDPNDYAFGYVKHLVKTYPSRRFAMVEAIADATVRAAFGYTAADCNVDITQAPTPMDAAAFGAALLDMRTQLAALVPDGGTTNFGSFYLPGEQHGWLTVSDSLYTGTAGGVALKDWLSEYVDGAAPTNVGP
jgi:hypothetical protein